MSNSTPTNGLLHTALWNAEQAACRLKLPDDIRRRVIDPIERIEATLHPILPDGGMLHAKFFLVRHNDVLGPSKGGIRMTPTVSLDEVTGLAMEMTWKTSLIGVPFGGGKAGIACNPIQLSPTVKEVLIRAFTRTAHRHIGPEIYVPAPDMGTNERDMGHIRDCISYSGGTSITNGCYVTGKPAVLGGIVGRREATGNGVVATVVAACDAKNLRMNRLRVAIHGFGNVGSAAARAFVRRGASVIAVADVSGGLYDAEGLDIERLSVYAEATGSIKGFPGGREISAAEVLETDCDVLVPAAAASVVNEKNAARIPAHIIAEGANAPLTPEADEILNQRGTFIIPDILCNAGGVYVSFLEYTQETQRDQMTREEVDRRLSERMENTFREVYSRSQASKDTMRHAAMDIGVGRVVDGVLARGLLP
jgi:glutamate dehydrogenase/leucine dehydrogenase